MKASIIGQVLLVVVVGACTSTERDAAPRAAEIADGSSKDGFAGDGARPEMPDGSRTDGAASCGRGSLPPDFLISMDRVTRYDGPVTVESTDAGGLELVPQGDAGASRALFTGVVPMLPAGTTLWASLDRYEIVGNPYSFRIGEHHVVRRSETGPVLAEVLHTFAGNTTFLGVPVTVSLLCSHPDSVTQSRCLTTQQYSVTVHGDSDVTFAPAPEGHVTVHGIEYAVWVVN
ncbi:MAG TPA: hypothetical protein VF395_11345, partial [Polyangiaceae bacterium]